MLPQSFYMSHADKASNFIFRKVEIYPWTGLFNFVGNFEARLPEVEISSK